MFAGTTLRLLVLHGIIAHHGGTGRYDSGRPLYLRGRIIQARYAFPHGTMRIEVPANLTVPDELPEVRQLGGYENWTGRPVPEGAGQARDLLLPPDVTGTLANMSGAPGVGDEIAAVVYRRCDAEGDRYSGELRVQMLYADGDSYRYRGTFTRFVDRCIGAVRPGRGASASPTASAPAATGSSSPAASPSADGDPPLLLLGGGAAVAAGFVIALIRLRMRRTGGGTDT